jgi:hypothetical protein
LTYLKENFDIGWETFTQINLDYYGWLTLTKFLETTTDIQLNKLGIKELGVMPAFQ